MATSFTNEHSVELSIIPVLKTELEKTFDHAAPIFPWLTREFCKISKTIHSEDKFRILMVFPRRPKIEPKTDNVFATINLKLLDFKTFASEYGIPVIAGCPVATSIWDLSKCTKPVWIDINEKTAHSYLYPLRVGPEETTKGLSHTTIIERVRSAHEFNFSDFHEFVLSSKYMFPYRPLFGPQYKPTYLLIK